MDYLVKIRSVQTPLNGQFSIGANTLGAEWDRGLQSWYIPKGVEQAPFSQWKQESNFRSETKLTPRSLSDFSFLMCAIW